MASLLRKPLVFYLIFCLPFDAHFLPFITAVVLSVPIGSYFILGRIRVLLGWGDVQSLGMMVQVALSVWFL